MSGDRLPKAALKSETAIRIPMTTESCRPGEALKKGGCLKAGLDLLSEVIRRECQVISRQPILIASHLHNMLQLYAGNRPEAVLLKDSAREALTDRIWLCLVNQPRIGESRKSVEQSFSHDSRVSGVAWSSDGSTLITYAGNQSYFWDISTGRLINSSREAAAFPSRCWTRDLGLFANIIRPGVFDGHLRKEGRIELSDRTGRLLRVLTGFGERIRFVRWAPDGSRLAVLCKYATVRLWNMALREFELELDLSSSSVFDLGFSADGRYMAIASTRADLLYDLETGGPPRQVVGSKGSTLLLAWSPTKPALAMAGREVWLWDVRPGSEPTRLGRHDDRVVALTWSPNASTLASAGGRSLILWDIRNNEGAVLGSHRGFIRAAEWSPNGAHIATVSGQEVAVWDVAKRKKHAIYKTACNAPKEAGEERGTAAFGFSPDSQSLACAAGTSVFLWNLNVKVRGADTGGHKRPATRISWSPDGNLLASLGEEDDHTARLWDGKSGRLNAVLKGHRNMAIGIAWHPQNQFLATAAGGMDMHVLVWKLPKGSKETGLAWESLEKGWEYRWVRGLSYSPDGHELALSVSDGTMHVWRDHDPDRHAKYRGKSGISTAPAWSPDGSLLAGGHRRAVSIWKSTGELQDRFPIGEKAEEVIAIAWSHDGKYLACADLAGKLAVWNVDNRHMSAAHNGGMSIIKLWAWSPDDRQLAFTMAQSLEPRGCVNILWDWMEDRTIEIKEQKTVTDAMLYVSHGDYLVEGNRDRTIRLLDSKTGETVASAFCLSPVRALLSPDCGKTVMAADNGALAGNRPIPYHFEIAGPSPPLQP